MSAARGLFPLPDDATLREVLSTLAARLREHGFPQTDVLPFPGDLRHLFNDPANVGRYLQGRASGYEASALAQVFYRHFGRVHPDLLTLFLAFTLTRPVAAAELEALIGRELYGRLIALEILIATDGEVRSRLQGSAVGGRILFHDHFEIREDDKPTHVFLGRCSTRLARHVEPLMSAAGIDRACDLCTGSGVQALLHARGAREVVGGDVNPRANAAANGVDNARFVQSDVWQKIDGRFDLVTANTPFLLLPEGSRALSGYGGKLGMEIASRIFAGLDERLTERGRAVLVASSAIRDSRDLLCDELAERFGHLGYEIHLHPISLHFPPAHYTTFARESVHHSVLYIADLRKGAARFSLEVHEWPPLVRYAHELQVRARRVIGWARHRG
jgi:carbamoyltransferase